MTKNLSDNLAVAKILMHHADRNGLNQILVRFDQNDDYDDVGKYSVENSILLGVEREHEQGDRKHVIEIGHGDLPVLK